MYNTSIAVIADNTLMASAVLSLTSLATGGIEWMVLVGFPMMLAGLLLAGLETFTTDATRAGPRSGVSNDE